ncbi:uncharacterized protein LOC5521005 [Nematostella vectensis]|uniref:uncharacterized protein LOC5521005 n=1 Tax=Nematostella vectensis TaxID=45351 RepID=UPI002076DEA6|nr:uncharacterized protein LOC5521005 [Nematostella vectensis]
MRMRSCNNLAPLYGGSCHGDDKESESCSVTPSCKGNFSEWSRWGPCNATCGPGVKRRTMNFTSFASPHCQGSLTVVRKCDNLCCPDHNDTTGYTVWSAWGPCNRTCLGISERTRNFTNYLLHDKCNGTFSEYQACNVTCCPSLDYDEIFTSWSVWGECNASCTGYKNRTRSHLMNVLAPYCKESLVQFDLCNDTCCPRDDNVKAFNPWGPWGPCNRTGYKLRNRTYVNQNLICDNGLSELRQCNATLWGNWSECSLTCGTGFQTRIQVNCIAANCLSENRTCNNFTCPVDPVDGNFTEWTSWSTCTRTCGAGAQWRMRTCTKPPAAYGGLNCSGPANQTQECETQPCPVGPVNGNFTEWTKWTTCTRTCGTGTQWRMRTCTNPAPANGGLNCSGPANQTQECETQLCPDGPVDGNFTEWTSWSTCTRTCGAGTQWRMRTCTKPPPANGGLNCSGPANQTQECETQPCPVGQVNGNFTEWTKWTTCTRTCGTGTQWRMRTCTNPAPANGGLNCSGPANQTQECSKQPCPVDGNWTEWSTWSYCNRPCGTGYENRSRFCSNPPPMYGGKDCKGEDHQAKTCNKSICPGAEATFEMRFTEEKCSQDLSSLNSPVSQALVKKIILNVESIYRDDSTYIKTVVHNFSCGSVVAFFTVAFSKINSLQLITMYEHIATSGKLTEMPVFLANTSTKKVPGSSPVFRYAQNTSSTSIYLEWLAVYASSLHGQPLSGYSIFYREDSTPFTPDSLKSVPSVHSTTINGLNKFSLYSFRVLAFTSNGNGIPSASITARTDEDVPSQGPTEFKGYASSSTTLTFSWGEIPPKSIHGILRGYNLSYTSLTTGEAGYTLMRPDRSWKVVQNLGKFTEYKVTICGFTIKGCGAESNELILRTFEDVPSVAPGDVGALNLTSMTDLRVSWSAIPPQHANGILHKYEVRYSRIKTSKKAERKPRVETMSVEPSALGVTLRDLVGFSVYEISVRAVTSIGPGPASFTYGETCRCPSVIYTNYWLLSPYTRPFNSTVSGLLPQIIQNMTAWVCESCSNGHGPTRLDFRNKDEYGGPALKASMAQVAEDITVGTKISFPLNGNKYMTKYPGGLPFFPLVMSPGVAFLAREETIESSAKSMFFSVLKCFPMIGFSLMLVYIAGFIIWLLDSRANDSCFPRGFVAGTYEGMWWSYISVTTVGYGDRSPKTVGARLFAIIWTLYGLVLISFITSAITTSLTSVTMATEIMLYGTDVAAIQNSSEYRLGILKNAKVHGYANLEEIHQALLRGEVKGALVDTYVVGSYKAMLSSGQIRVDRVLERSFGYGLVLSGQAVFLQDEFKNYMLYNSAKISRLVETSTSKVKVPFKSVAETKSTGLFDSGASMFRNSLLSSGSLLAFLTFLGLAWHFLWHKRRRNIITNKVESWENNRAIKLKRETHAELREVVEQFYSNIMTNISQLSRWHRQEQRDLLAARKAQRRQPREVSTTHLKTLSFVNLDDCSDEKQSSEC